MASSAIDFLTTAEKLLKTEDEIELRASISRSYYGAYHFCREYLGMSDNDEFVGGKGGVHEKLIDTFKHSSKPSDKGIAYILADLKGRRVIADYKLQTSLKTEDAETAFEMANTLFSRLKS